MSKRLLSNSLPPKLKGESLGSLTLVLKGFKLDHDHARVHINVHDIAANNKNDINSTRTVCRISFWGQEDQFFDIDSQNVRHNDDENDIRRACRDVNGDGDNFMPVHMEYPLIGSIVGIERYFSDMNILPIPVFQISSTTIAQTAQTVQAGGAGVENAGGEVLLVGQGNVSLPYVWIQLQESLRASTTTTSSTGNTMEMMSSVCSTRVPLVSTPSAMEMNQPYTYQAQQIGELELDFVLSVYCGKADTKGSVKIANTGGFHEVLGGVSVDKTSCKISEIKTLVSTKDLDVEEKAENTQIVRSSVCDYSLDGNSSAKDQKFITLDEVNASSLISHQLGMPTVKATRAKVSQCKNVNPANINVRRSPFPKTCDNPISLCEFYLDDEETFSLATEDDSILMDAMINNDLSLYATPLCTFSRRPMSFTRPQRRERRNMASVLSIKGSKRKSTSTQFPIIPTTLQSLDKSQQISTVSHQCRDNDSHSISSMDLIEDTIISKASAKLRVPFKQCLLNSHPEKKKLVSDQEKLKMNPDAMSNQQVTLCMFLLLSKLCSMHSEGGSPKYTHIRVKASYEYINENFMNTKIDNTCTRSVTYTEQIINFKQSDNLSGEDFVWTTDLSVGDKNANHLAVIIEIWTHHFTCSTEINSTNVKKPMSDIRLLAERFSIEIPRQLTSTSSIPAVVKHNMLQIQGHEIRDGEAVQLTLAIGLAGQVRKFCGLTRSATVIQRWWNCIQTSSPKKIPCVKSKRSKCSLFEQKASLIQNLWRQYNNIIIPKRTERKSPVHVDGASVVPRKVNETGRETTFSESAAKISCSKSQRIPATDMDTYLGTHSKVFLSGINSVASQNIDSKQSQEEQDKDCKIERVQNEINSGREISLRREDDALISVCSTDEVIIRFGECSGIREIITLWADHKISHGLKIPFTFSQDDWKSSGIVITFSIPSRSGGVPPSAGNSIVQEVHFSSAIYRMDARRHSVAVDCSFSIFLDETPEMNFYLQSENLISKLWFIPMISEGMLQQYPVFGANQVTVPVEAHLMCDTNCPLNVLTRRGDTISFLCPWTDANSQNIGNDIGQIQITIGTKGSEGRVSSPINLCHNQGFDVHTCDFPDNFDWNLPDKIEEAMSQANGSKTLFIDSAKHTSIVVSKELGQLSNFNERVDNLEVATLTKHHPVELMHGTEILDNRFIEGNEKAYSLQDDKEFRNEIDSKTDNNIVKIQTAEVQHLVKSRAEERVNTRVALDTKQRGTSTSESDVVIHLSKSPDVAREMEIPPGKIDTLKTEQGICKGEKKNEVEEFLSDSWENESDSKAYDFHGESKHSTPVSRNAKERKKLSFRSTSIEDCCSYSSRVDSQMLTSVRKVDDRLYEVSSDEESVLKTEHIRPRTRPKRSMCTSFISDSSSDEELVSRGLKLGPSYARTHYNDSESSSSDSSSTIEFRGIQRQNRFMHERKAKTLNPHVDSDSSSDWE